MKEGNKIFFCLLPGLLLFGNLAFGQRDYKDCKDHPFFTRMPNFYINDCKESDFDAFEFYDPDSQGKKKVKAEGEKYWIQYMIQDALRDKAPSPLQIIRNHENAVKKIGGKTYTYFVNSGGGDMHFRYTKDRLEVWGQVYVSTNGQSYMITLIEKGEMAQDVVADAKTMAADISASGKVVIYGIYFDFNKADVKPESEPTLKEITRLLQQDAKLRLYVVGHTDNAGGLDYNMKLSQQRADAVVKELASKYKVEDTRLKALGVGPAAPVTSNDTEDGKAKNRRVELVKQ
ncbi:MAG: OmpA family protein [Acidobacteria bacterium]|nr:OmpA family protein [Acidobacteriota bacterium]